MPIVRIDIESGKSTEYRRSILHGVRSAITEALGVHDDRVMQRIVETPSEDIDATEVRSDRLTIVEISMLPRTAELKERLYHAIADKLGREPGISRHDLVVVVAEPEAECFFLNGQMQCAVKPADTNASAEQSKPAEKASPAKRKAGPPSKRRGTKKAAGDES